jgi:acetoacetyl-CoA synthetase
MSTVETLTAVWERVLQRSPIGPRENFYELGGTDPRADEVVSEIAREYKRELPSCTINFAPTIEELAAMLERPVLPKFSPFVLIKPGSEPPPIFIAHGLAGTVEFFKLARYIRTPNPVYGIQAKGVDGLEEPYVRVEDMAGYYLEALKEVWPQGPCVLIGYSFGGLVALEMGLRLLESGREVALMTLIDTYPHPHFLERDQRVRLMVQRVVGHGREMWDLPPREAAGYFMNGLRRRFTPRGSLDLDELRPDAHPLSFARNVPIVKEKAFRGYQLYQPRFYPGKVKFITTAIKSFFPTDPASVWQKLVAQLDIEVIPGDHLEIVRTEFEGLAAVLTRDIQKIMTAHD